MSTIISRDVETSLRSDTWVRAEYAALTQRAGAIVLPEPGILQVEGRDRAEWLHKLTTINIKTMPERSAAYALLLEAKGHVVADFVLCRTAEFFLLYTSRSAHGELASNLRRAIFREKVTLTDRSDGLGIIAVQGPDTAHSLSQILEISTSDLDSPITIGQMLVVPNPRVRTRIDLVVPRNDIPDLSHRLAVNGVESISLAAMEMVRIEAGIPQFGDDFGNATLALEARLDEFVAPDKGCYPGQETIARIRNRGHVNRVLVQLRMEGDQVPRPGDPIWSAEKEIGNITSTVWSFAQNAPVALGYTRREAAEPGTRVQISHGDAQLEGIVMSRPIA